MGASIKEFLRLVEDFVNMIGAQMSGFQDIYEVTENLGELPSGEAKQPDPFGRDINKYARLHLLWERVFTLTQQREALTPLTQGIAFLLMCGDTIVPPGGQQGELQYTRPYMNIQSILLLLLLLLLTHRRCDSVFLHHSAEHPQEAHQHHHRLHLPREGLAGDAGLGPHLRGEDQCVARGPLPQRLRCGSVCYVGSSVFSVSPLGLSPVCRLTLRINRALFLLLVCLRRADGTTAFVTGVVLYRNLGAIISQQRYENPRAEDDSNNRKHNYRKKGR